MQLPLELRPARYEDLAALPDTMVGEILNDRLVASPRPTPRHGWAVTVLSGLLSDPYNRNVPGPGGWWLLSEPEIHVGGNIVVPDLAGWRRERLPRLPDAAHFSLAPDWVCEVLSPATARYDRITKLGIYGRWCVPVYWLLEPALRTLEVLRFDAGRWVVEATFCGDDQVSVVPFVEVTLPLGALWTETG